MRCPSCGEYDGTWIDHNTVDEEDPGYDETKTHTYCRNCDYGICEAC